MALLPVRMETNRLLLRNWDSQLGDNAQRLALEAELAEILTPRVLAELPPTMQLSDAPDAISAWIEARALEAEAYTVALAPGGSTIGLLILASVSDGSTAPTVHIGYLLSERAWGKGYATELLRALPSALTVAPGTTLVAGVARSNPASVRVLEKAGFLASPTPVDLETLVFTTRLSQR